MWESVISRFKIFLISEKNKGHRSVCMGGEWKPSFGFGPWFNFIVGGKTH